MTNKANNIQEEYDTLNKNHGWPMFFQEIRIATSNNNFTTSESTKPQNKALNRYRDVSPYDHSRVVLNKGPTNYINANIVKVEKAGRSYILTQGPLSNTVSHFWLMVWEQNSRAVLMLNKLIEKKQEKCCQYWPSKIGFDHMLRMDDVGLTLEYLEYHDYSHYLTRTFKLTETSTNKFHEIVQFHYTTWPDFGVPSSPTAFLQFLHRVRDAGVLERDVGPSIVHCSAGIGRSGTFCLVDSCLVLIEKNGIESVNVKDILLELRQYRMGLIQTPEQLRFSYQAIIEGVRMGSQLNDNKVVNICLVAMSSKNFKLFLALMNCNEHDLIVNNMEEEVPEAHSSEEEDEPPPLPPPRNDSLRNTTAPGDRPLPMIPNSASLSDFTYENSDSERESYPNGPLPTVPADNEEEEDVHNGGSSVDEPDDEEEDETEHEQTGSPASENSTTKERCTSPSELRQRSRAKRNDQLAAQVRDMKRRQQAHEQFTQFKRPKHTLPD